MVLHSLYAPNLVISLCNAGIHVETRPLQAPATPDGVRKATRQDHEGRAGDKKAGTSADLADPLQTTSASSAPGHFPHNVGSFSLVLIRNLRAEN